MQSDGGMSQFDTYLANAGFTEFAKRHRLLTAAVFPVLFLCVYIGAGYGLVYGLPYVDRVTISIVLDLMLAALLVLYCGAIALHIPDIHEQSILSRPVFWIVTVCLIGIVLIVAQAASSLVVTMVSDNGLTQYESSKTGSSVWAQVFLTIICAPLFEEMMFRKCLYGSFSRLMPPVVAAVISSLMFAVGHGTLAHIPMTFLLGMLNCWLYARLGRIIVPIIVHTICNVVATFFGGIVYFPAIFTEVMPVTIMYGICLAVLIILLLQQPKAIAGYNVVSSVSVGSDLYDTDRCDTDRGYTGLPEDNFDTGERVADELGGGVLGESEEVPQVSDL